MAKEKMIRCTDPKLIWAAIDEAETAALDIDDANQPAEKTEGE